MYVAGEGIISKSESSTCGSGRTARSMRCSSRTSFSAECRTREARQITNPTNVTTDARLMAAARRTALRCINPRVGKVNYKLQIRRLTLDSKVPSMQRLYGRKALIGEKNRNRSYAKSDNVSGKTHQMHQCRLENELYCSNCENVH